MREEDEIFSQDINQRGRLEVLYSRKGRFHQRSRVRRAQRGHSCLQQKQGAKSGPASNFKKLETTRQDEEGGDPDEAHRRLTCSSCSRGYGC
jgi:hypothetical protein